MNFLQELYKEFSSVNPDDIPQLLEDAAQELLRVHPDNTRVKAYSNQFRDSAFMRACKKSKSKTKAGSKSGSASEQTDAMPAKRENGTVQETSGDLTTEAAAQPTPTSTASSSLSSSSSPSPSPSPSPSSTSSTPAPGNLSTTKLGSIPEETGLPPIEYIGYESEHQLAGMVSLIENDLSEPYSIYTYRYFLHQWPKLSFLAKDMEKDKCIGVIVCRLDSHGHSNVNRGYIAMLAVSKEYRNRKIGSTLVLMAIQAMKDAGADEIVLETEYTNTSAIALYQRMGFIKDKRLYRYYLNGVDAFRLKLFCKPELIGIMTRETMDTTAG